MISIPVMFDSVLEHLFDNYKHFRFEYEGASKRWSSVVREHIGPGEHPGVYLLRTAKQPDIIYVGKAGTINQKGSFKRQGLRGRLLAERAQKKPADQWFREASLLYGPIDITCIVLGMTLSPGLAEATLLQAHLNQYGRLPALNKSL